MERAQVPSSDLALGSCPLEDHLHFFSRHDRGVLTPRPLSFHPGPMGYHVVTNPELHFTARVLNLVETKSFPWIGRCTEDVFVDNSELNWMSIDAFGLRRLSKSAW